MTPKTAKEQRNAHYIQYTTSSSHAPLDHTHRPAHLYLNEVDWLHESGLGGERAGIEDAASGGDDLAPSAVNGVSVQRHIKDVVANTAHVLLTEHTLGGGGVTVDEDIISIVVTSI